MQRDVISSRCRWGIRIYEHDDLTNGGVCASDAVLRSRTAKWEIRMARSKHRKDGSAAVTVEDAERAVLPSVV